MGSPHKQFKVEYAAAGAVLGLMAAILIIRPITGVADNGDFARIMNSTGLYYLSDEYSDRYFGFVNRVYGIGSAIPLGGGYLSTQLPLVMIAILLCKSVWRSGLFDIRFLSAIYMLILGAAIFTAVRCCRKRSMLVGLAAALAVILIFCDSGYTSYFNSLYGEPVTMVSLLLMTAMALMMAIEERPALWMMITFCAACFFFAGAKVQNSPAGILAALLCIRLAGVKRDVLWRRFAMAAAAAVLTVSIVCYASVSKEIRVCNKYQTVFYGILRGSPDPAGDLSELGLDTSLAVLAGTNYFMESYPVDIRTPAFKNMLQENVHYADVLAFYIRHPRRFLQKLEYAAQNGFKLIQGFGNYEQYPGVQYKQTTKVFTFWSDFKMAALPHTLPFIAAFYGVAALALLYEYRRAYRAKQEVSRWSAARKRFFIEYMGFILLAGILQFVLPVLGDGDADMSKHLFFFNLSFDLLFLSGVCYLTGKAAAVLVHLRDKRKVARLQAE